MHSNVNFLLHENLSCATPSWQTSKFSTRGHRSTSFPKHCAIQKNIVHCNVGANDIPCLLSPFRNCPSHNFCHCITSTIHWLSSGSYRHYRVLKLNTKPVSLLLEDKRSKANSKGQDQTVVLLLRLETTIICKTLILNNTVLSFFIRMPPVLTCSSCWKISPRQILKYYGTFNVLSITFLELNLEIWELREI